MAECRISVCICTRNRPDDLIQALQSLMRSAALPYEIIVSDDSTDMRSRHLVEEGFPSVKYTAGPRRGLAANRNHALSHVTGTHVLFIDDDVVVDRDFLRLTTQALEAYDSLGGAKWVVTGIENKRGSLIYPHDQTFLGFQSKVYGSGDAMKTIVINSTVFPVELFREVGFDEFLIYGYEEVDIATRAVAKGYRIALLDKAVNYHDPSEINRDYYKPHIVSSRLYVTFKRYFYTEKKWLKAVSFFAIGIFHAILHGAKTGGGRGIRESLRGVASSIRYIRAHRKRYGAREGAL
ncbi:glycosyltransferase [Cohnella lubricantis]|uniref:Glycosyltransferase n=1 Tax=Cohnella lubricantis TaxID=2163172 RepID=A0A841TEG2_9BACL|nr:glycosyltransferase [Cohnella lubricantis]MBB6676841.1 glycosyltransferase [Cohnella lubricantis]MBP2119421.1 GT2 family glycosyltransferase [Cohnella lubricantis]